MHMAKYAGVDTYRAAKHAASAAQGRSRSDESSDLRVHPRSPVRPDLPQSLLLPSHEDQMLTGCTGVDDIITTSTTSATLWWRSRVRGRSYHELVVFSFGTSPLPFPRILSKGDRRGRSPFSAPATLPLRRGQRRFALASLLLEQVPIFFSHLAQQADRRAEPASSLSERSRPTRRESRAWWQAHADPQTRALKAARIVGFCDERKNLPLSGSVPVCVCGCPASRILTVLGLCFARKDAGASLWNADTSGTSAPGCR